MHRFCELQILVLTFTTSVKLLCYTGVAALLEYTAVTKRIKIECPTKLPWQILCVHRCRIET